MKKPKEQFKMTEEQKALFDKLTTLQQQIALNSISGMSDIDSYKNSSGKAKTIKAMEASVSQILSNHKVVAFLDAMKEVAVNNAIMSREEMMERLSSIGRVSINDLVEWGSYTVTDDNGEKAKQSVWAVKESAMQNPEAMATISELSAGKDGIKIKQHSPLAAMKQLAELAGYNSAQKHEHTSPDGSMTPQGISIEITPLEASNAYKDLMDE